MCNQVLYNIQQTQTHTQVLQNSSNICDESLIITITNRKCVCMCLYCSLMRHSLLRLDCILQFETRRKASSFFKDFPLLFTSLAINVFVHTEGITQYCYSANAYNFFCCCCLSFFPSSSPWITFDAVNG